MKLKGDKDNEVEITLASFWTLHATSRADARADSLINKMLTRPRSRIACVLTQAEDPWSTGGRHPSRTPCRLLHRTNTVVSSYGSFHVENCVSKIFAFIHKHIYLDEPVASIFRVEEWTK
jgi:hypothetical protein